MRTVKVNVASLEGRLRDNRDKHRGLYEEAMEGYRREVIAFLEKLIEDAKAGRPVKQYIDLPIPEDHTKDYDRAIEMCQWATETEVELSQAEFAQYVMDDWGWRQDFVATAANYTQVAA